jgi:hypothetical protein
MPLVQVPGNNWPASCNSRVQAGRWCVGQCGPGMIGSPRGTRLVCCGWCCGSRRCGVQCQEAVYHRKCSAGPTLPRGHEYVPSSTQGSGLLISLQTCVTMGYCQPACAQCQPQCQPQCQQEQLGHLLLALVGLTYECTLGVITVPPLKCACIAAAPAPAAAAAVSCCSIEQCSVPEASGQHTPSPEAPASQHHLQVCAHHRGAICLAALPRYQGSLNPTV